MELLLDSEVTISFVSFIAGSGVGISGFTAGSGSSFTSGTSSVTSSSVTTSSSVVLLASGETGTAKGISIPEDASYLFDNNNKVINRR